MLLIEMLTGKVPWQDMSNPMQVAFIAPTNPMQRRKQTQSSLLSAANFRDGLQVVYSVAVLKRRPRIPASCPPAMRSLLQDSWHQSPARRPPFTAILQRLLVSAAPFSPHM